MIQVTLNTFMGKCVLVNKCTSFSFHAWVFVHVQMMTVVMAVMRWAAPRPVPTVSSNAPADAASQTTGPVMVTTIVATSVMKAQLAEVDLHVRMFVLLFKML